MAEPLVPDLVWPPSLAVEHSLAWFARRRRLTAGQERRADILEAYDRLAPHLTCLRFAE